MPTPITPESKPAPITAPTSEAPPTKIGGLKTFASDIAEAVKREQGSVIKIAVAEVSRRQDTLAPSMGQSWLTSRRNLPWLVLSGFLFLAGLGLIFFSLKLKDGPVQTDKIPAPAGLVYAEKIQEINLDELDAGEVVPHLAAELKKFLLADGTAVNFQISAGGRRLTATEFLSRTRAQPPGTLERALENDFALGAYRAGGRNLPFLVLENYDYSASFAGMLEWENRLLENFYRLFGINVSGDNFTLFTKKWSDRLISNFNARVLRAPDGQIALLYAFVDDQTIVLATDPVIVDEIAKR